MVALIVRGRFACGRDLWVGRVVRASRSQPISRSTRMRGNVGEQGNKTRGAAVEQSKENAQARRRGQRKREREGYCLGVCVWAATVGGRIPPLLAPGVLEVWRAHGLDGRRERVYVRMGAARFWCVGGVCGFAGDGGWGLVGYVQRAEVPHPAKLTTPVWLLGRCFWGGVCVCARVGVVYHNLFEAIVTRNRRRTGVGGF